LSGGLRYDAHTPQSKRGALSRYVKAAKPIVSVTEEHACFDGNNSL
jgi:hypothetical protein